MLEAILQLQLRMRCETIADGRVDPTQILTLASVNARAIGYFAEELLVPAERAKELGVNLYFASN